MMDDQPKTPPTVGTATNLGSPLKLEHVEPLAGFSAEAKESGKTIKVWTRLALSSDDPLFHRLVNNLSGVINHKANTAGIGVNLHRTNTLLLVIKANGTGELWLDTAAVCIHCMVKRPVQAGMPVFEQDIADVTGMSFPCVHFDAEDKVLCIFRQGWRFGFAFDMNPDGNLDVESFNRTLGDLYRGLRYRHLYDAVSEPAIFDRLLSAGWFPFIEIISSDFKDLLHHCEAGFDLTDMECKILVAFDEARVKQMLHRWLSKPHFVSRETLLSAAISAFINKEPVAVIKIVLTEIEGILNEAHRAAHDGQGAKLNTLLSFAEASASRKAGGSNTLLFPVEFSRYMREHTFANFDPVAQTGTASSRHAVGHGAASQVSYTMPRALQAILTLDQLAFYT